MSAQDSFEPLEESQATGHRWLVPMDFSVQASAALEWVFAVMKPNDHLLILNVLNLKAPTYAHDMVINEQLTKESQEKLKEMKQRALEKGFQFVNTISTRGEPAKKVCSYAVEDKIDTIVMGRRGMSNLKRMLNGSVSEYVIANAPCAVCVMGRGVEEKKRKEDLEKKDREIAELTASASENEGEGAKVPFFLPRKHSVKNYYTDSDSLVCSSTHTQGGLGRRERGWGFGKEGREKRKSFGTEEEKHHPTRMIHPTNRRRKSTAQHAQ